MRGCLWILVLATALVVGGAWFGSPVLAAWLVEAALPTAGLSAAATEVDVSSDPPIGILTGHADVVRITADAAAFDRIHANRLDVTVLDVDLLGRRFASVDGTLTGVLVRQGERAVPVESIDVDGPVADARALVVIAAADVERLAEEAIGERLPAAITDVALTEPDGLSFAAGGLRRFARLVVEDGGLVLAIPVPDSAIRAEVIPPGGPFRVESVNVAGGQLLLGGTVDVASLLGF